MPAKPKSEKSASEEKPADEIPSDVKAALGGVPIPPPPTRKQKNRKKNTTPRRDAGGLLAMAQPKAAASRRDVEKLGSTAFSMIQNLERALNQADTLVSQIDADAAKELGVDIAKVKTMTKAFRGVIDDHFPSEA